MINKRLYFGILIFLLVFGIMVFGCEIGLSGDGNNGTLDGTWNNSSMSIIISGVGYTYKLNGEDYSKGIIYYKAPNLRIDSTHAWDKNSSSWISSYETITCSYELNGNSLTIKGLYSIMKGVWTKE